MDHLFRPWRYAYVTRGRDAERCVFCEIAESPPSEDPTRFVVHRGRKLFVVLNIFPYNSGHLMIVPYRHAAELSDLGDETLHELAALASRAERVLRESYRPEGLNLGMNLGAAAGAGIEAHLHLHVVPRWKGDTNFMTVAGGCRVLPEGLEETWRRLHGGF
jgi:ATP adenylyltransferase